MTKQLTEQQQDRALEIVAGWLGPKMGHRGPAPTGEDAAYRAEGPMLNRAWDWPTDPQTSQKRPTPTILLEGGPYEWAYDIGDDDAVHSALAKVGVAAEPYAGYALCLYPVDGD